MRVELNVLGTPSPKGSGRAILIQTSNGPIARFIPSSSSKNSTDRAAWESAIRYKAREVLGVRAEPVFMNVAVAIDVTFRMRRLASHFGKNGLKPSAPSVPTVSPDIDKLLRSTLDALTGLVFDDDSRVSTLIARKMYASPGEEGALIIVTQQDHPGTTQNAICTAGNPGLKVENGFTFEGKGTG